MLVYTYDNFSKQEQKIIDKELAGLYGEDYKYFEYIHEDYIDDYLFSMFCEGYDLKDVVIRYLNADAIIADFKLDYNFIEINGTKWYYYAQ